MRRSTLIMAILALAVSAGILAFYAENRESEYQRLIRDGEAALLQDATFAAIEAFSGAIALKQDSMLAYLRRGETYSRRGDLVSALRDLRVAHELDPTATRPLEQLGDVTAARHAYTRAATFYEAYLRLDDRSPRVLYKLALMRYREGKPEAAVDKLHEAVALAPTMAEAHYLLGVCFRAQDDTTDATAALLQAIRLQPALVPAREELADIYSVRGRHRDQIDQLEALRSLEPSRPERYVAVGLAYAASGWADSAVATLQAAAERFPDDARVQLALGRVWMQLAEKGDPAALARAKETLAASTAMPSPDSEVFALYGRALLLSDDLNGAEQMLHQAVSRWPVSGNAFQDLAAVSQRLGHFGAARTALLKQLALSGESLRASQAARLGDLSLQLNQPEEAADWYEQAARLSNDEISILTRLANAQLAGGQLDAAAQTIARAKDKDPQSAAVEDLVRELARAKR